MSCSSEVHRAISSSNSPIVFWRDLWRSNPTTCLPANARGGTLCMPNAAVPATVPAPPLKPERIVPSAQFQTSLPMTTALLDFGCPLICVACPTQRRKGRLWPYQPDAPPRRHARLRAQTWAEEEFPDPFRLITAQGKKAVATQPRAFSAAAGRPSQARAEILRTAL
jgi:hypothetical protein